MEKQRYLKVGKKARLHFLTACSHTCATILNCSAEQNGMGWLRLSFLHLDANRFRPGCFLNVHAMENKGMISS